MITGLNTDIEYQGKIYHVQTEDTGRNNPTIVTILFHSGAILATRKTGYADRVKAENLTVILKELMNQQHKEMIRDLQSGRLFGSASQPQSLTPVKSPPVQPAPTGQPAGGEPSPLAADKTSASASANASKDSSGPVFERKKSLDDLILDYLSTREERKKP